MEKLTVKQETIDRICELNKSLRSESKEGFHLMPSGEEMVAYLTDPRRLELQELINNLSQEEKDELSAITWIGRGDFADFDDARAYAARFHGEDAFNYLGPKPLHEYLPAGLEELAANEIYPA